MLLGLVKKSFITTKKNCSTYNKKKKKKKAENTYIQNII